jgi:uncharacterized membrane protein YraQ (UPF0718 family)
LDETLTRKIRIAIILSFIIIVVGLLVYSRIMAYSLAPTMQPADFSEYTWYEIPFYYLWDYFSHAWICLLFAFTVAGLVYEFMPKEVITKYMSSSKVGGYAIGASFAPFFTTCSCTMVPLFAGILYAGSGIGPAITFLLMAPSANILTILITGELISWEMAGVRIISSLLTAVVAGIIISKTSWGKAIEDDIKAKMRANSTIQKVDLIKLPLDERLLSALKFGVHLAKQILPYFIVGLVIVAYVTAYTPPTIVEGYLTGIVGVLLASIIGGPLYTPTLVEIVLGRSLIQLGMSKAALLSWLMGQPYDIPNMTAVSRIVKWKVVLLYAIIAWMCSIFFGITYGLIIGAL